MHGHTFLGLDLGTTKVCGVVGRVSGRYCDCLAAATAPSRGLQRGMVSDIAETAQSIREVTARLQRSVGVQLGPAWVGVTGAHLAGKTVRGAVCVAKPLRGVTFEDIQRALAKADREVMLPPDREIVHSLPRGFRLDGLAGVANPTGMAGQHLEVETHIVSAPTAALQNVERAFERAEVVIADIVAGPVATGRAILAPDEQDLGVAVLDIGGGTTDIAVFERGSVCFTAAVPVAGDHITRDLAVGLRVAVEEAERIKVTQGAACAARVAADEELPLRTAGIGDLRVVARRSVAEIIEARVEEILDLAFRQLVDAEPRPRIPAGLVLTGGAALLPGILELAEQRFGLPARLGTPRVAGAFGSVVDSPVYATAVGLVAFADEVDGRARAPRPHGVETAIHAMRAWWRSLVPWGS